MKVALKTRVLVAVSLTVSTIISTQLFADESQWMGAFRGATVPGYEITQTVFISGDFSGFQHQGVYDEFLDYMRTMCIKRNGVALVNVSLTPAIGEVRFKDSSGQTKTVSPGLFIGGLADCVLKVQKKAP